MSVHIIPANPSFAAIFGPGPAFKLRLVIGWRVDAMATHDEAWPVLPGTTDHNDAMYMGILDPGGLVVLRDGRTYGSWREFLRAEEACAVYAVGADVTTYPNFPRPEAP